MSRREESSQVLAVAARLGHTKVRDATLAAAELDYVRRAVEAAEGNRSLAAAVLGIDRKTVQRILDGAKKKSAKAARRK